MGRILVIDDEADIARSCGARSRPTSMRSALLSTAAMGSGALRPTTRTSWRSASLSPGCVTGCTTAYRR